MRKAILMFLIPALIAVACIFIVKSSKTPEVEHKSAAFGPGTGYTQVAEEYTVTASTSYKWQHGTSSGWLMLIGFLLFASAGFYVYVCNRKAWQINLLVLIILIAGGYLMIFGKHIFRYYELNKFQRTISADLYEANKDNLDAIFLQ